MHILRCRAIRTIDQWSRVDPGFVRETSEYTTVDDSRNRGLGAQLSYAIGSYIL